MKIKQTLIARIILLLLLIMVWDGLCIAQNDSGKVRRGRRIDPLQVSPEPSSEDTAYYFEEAVEEEVVPAGASTSTAANDEYINQPVKPHDFNEQDWSKAVEGLDYSKDVPEEEKNMQPRQFQGGPGLGVGSFGPAMQAVLFGLVILVLAFVLFMLIGGRYNRNKKIKKEETFSIEDIEERMHESDLDRFLREALSKGDYRLAVRIYYLAIIKELSIKEFIRWKKDKTNREYLNEVVARKPEIYNDFRDTTLAFEKVWYGDITITEGDYTNISPRFKRFIESLGRLN